MLLLVALWFSCGGRADGAEIQLGTLFQKRSWAAMDEVYASKKEPTAMEHSLMANALRMRNKWSEAVAILERHAATFPATVRPYAEMTLILGY